MRALRLDYVVTRTPSMQGVVVVVLAVIMVAAAWHYYSGIQQQAGTLDKQLQELREISGIKAPAKTMQKKSSGELLEKIDQAKKLADFLLIPWGDVFAALENAALDDSALLAIEPDPKKRQLKITAEAKNQDVMFDYVQRLEATPQLSGAYLLKHEILEDIDQHPIRFVAVAQWQETRKTLP
ncbi:MAG: hypothetical protein ACAH10_02580 [Methylophilaceae bacterium]